MKSIQSFAPSENEILVALQNVKRAGEDYAIKALIAGQILLEYKAALPPLSHSETTGKFVAKKEDDRIGSLFDKVGLSRPTGYRYMQAAERVGRVQLGIPMHEPYRPVIDIDGAQSLSLSHCLTAPEKSLPEEALRYRQGVLDFMADHTLGEATRAVLDGDSDAKRITLAAGGKSKGGKGSGDRKAFDVFAKTKLKHLTTFMGQKLTVNQKAQIVAAFDAALETWPRWVVEGIAEKCRTELKLAESDRAARSTFEKA